MIALFHMKAFWKDSVMLSFCMPFLKLLCTTEHKKQQERHTFCRGTVLLRDRSPAFLSSPGMVPKCRLQWIALPN